VELSGVSEVRRLNADVLEEILLFGFGIWGKINIPDFLLFKIPIYFYLFMYSYLLYGDLEVLLVVDSAGRTVAQNEKQ
jgi:hypothetical protein